MSKHEASQESRETDIVGTLMSLTVAFTLAMAFRGFVLEGFVIPTGSMGPTLMGAHARLDGPLTGYEFATDVQVAMQRDPREPFRMFDPMLSQRRPVADVAGGDFATQARAGDRVLVLKPLYLINEPRRWDVVVFKNPTDPVGDTQNYIKRLVGLPNESFALLDGDVFTGPLGADPATLGIQRKPEYVQRAVWQPVYNSDYEPIMPLDQLKQVLRRPWDGPPWAPKGDGSAWKLAPSRAWTCTGGATELEWRADVWPIDTWNAYNMLRYTVEAGELRAPGAMWWRGITFPVNDVRLGATIECPDLAGFATEFELRARKQVFRFKVRGDGTASMSRQVAETGDMRETMECSFDVPRDGVLGLEFWHVDQQLWMFVNGDLVGQLPYEFGSLPERLESSLARRADDPPESLVQTNAPFGPVLSWKFDSKGAFTLHRVRVDRDLYYQPAMHSGPNQVNPPEIRGPAFATYWRQPAQLGADDFLMLGDNSSHSRDSRLWGHANRLSTAAFGESQPGVVPRAMIVGKAWCVYFPAPMPIWPGGMTIVPDFGRVRFIR